ncbi:hypothetical protein [Methyloceanibacter sp.]|uniref:hypothetical protein n=1 Tax=Methyloceanibacter sp. TaxID=1965321 RepID=UPI002080EEFA|nr:hypothetical protein [Methyloceanibacter sp.]GFO83601.1 MAG: hypothetical protein A49_32280 [Methyloceanibacter sp.]HML92915.1 hypothetical protein [Methyloceanibacter sp.]
MLKIRLLRLFIALLGLTCAAQAHAQGTGEQAGNDAVRLEHDELRNDLGRALQSATGKEDAPIVPAPYVPTWSVVGTLSPLYTNNAFQTPDGARSDVYFEPDISLRLDGRLAPSTSYRFYARSDFSAFARLNDANSSLARFGLRLAQDISDWQLAASYENRLAFDGVFEGQPRIANDLQATLARNFAYGRLIVAPLVRARQRFSEIPEARRFRLDLAVALEYGLGPKWALVSRPFYEMNWFEAGLNAGRRDAYYSVDIGLRYQISDGLNLTTSIVNEIRNSNVRGRDFNMIEIGPSLDFVF